MTKQEIVYVVLTAGDGMMMSNGSTYGKTVRCRKEFENNWSEVAESDVPAVEEI